MYDVELVDLQAQHTAVVRGRTDPSGIGGFVGQAFGRASAAAAEQGLDVTGPPFGRYGSVADGGLEVEAGFPVSGVVVPDGYVGPGMLPGGTCARTLHVGGYDQVHHAYAALEAWVTENGRVTVGPPWESYLDPPEVAEPRTLVFWPCETARARQAQTPTSERSL